MVVSSFRAGLTLLLLGAGAAVAPSAAASPRPYTAVSGGYRSVARFTASYSGAGSFATTYHSNPPNPGGAPDTDDAHDTSRQRWSLTYSGWLTIPTCGGSRSRPDPCRRIVAPQHARGSTSQTATIDHVHVDGLYSQLNASESCAVAEATPPGRQLSTGLRVDYLPSRRAISVTALDPLYDTVTLMPQSCPSQTDPIDGFFDNYFMPGFSFASGYGPDRWFTSAAVQIPISLWHRAKLLTIPLALTRAGSAPAGCAVPHPGYQRCETGGTWSGMLMLRRR